MTRPGPAPRGRRTGPFDRRPTDREPLAARGQVGRGPVGGRQHGGAGRPGGERGAGHRPAAGSGPRGGGGHRTGRGAAADRFEPPYRIVTLRTPDGPLRARVDPRESTRPARRRRGPVRRFVRAWGWRAYALPLLVVLSVLCGIDVANGAEAGLPLLDPAPSSGRAPAAAPAPPTTAPTSANPAPKPTSTGIFVDDGGTGTARPLPPTALPAGGPYAQKGNGRYTLVPGTSKVYGTGPLHRFTVELETGVPGNGAEFAAAVERTLSDPRSWGNGGRASFQRVDSGAVDFRVSLTASLTVRKLCGYDLPYETSCYNGEQARVVINDARWVRGAVAYAGNLPGYRLYVVNHEVGHALGNNHVQCPRKGALAPIMMQQTLGISTPGIGACRPNPWPYP